MDVVERHRHHIVCRGCGAVADVECVPDGAGCAEAVSAPGFVIDRSEVTFQGLCPDCRP